MTPETTVYTLKQDQLQMMLALMKGWADKNEIDNLAVVAQAMRHVAGILEKVAAQNNEAASKLHIVKKDSSTKN